jgi:hypothetical protein
MSSFRKTFCFSLGYSKQDKCKFFKSNLEFGQLFHFQFVFNLIEATNLWMSFSSYPWNQLEQDVEKTVYPVVLHLFRAICV